MNTLKWNGNEIARAVDNAVPVLLRDAAEVILDESNKIAPIDEGTMISTGNVSVDGNKATVSYDTPYALKQHENDTLQHKNGRQAHFLLKAFDNNQRRVVAYIASELGKRLG